MSSPETLSILRAHGWTVERENPLEVRHDETGSFATHLAAEAVAAQLLAHMADGPEEAEEVDDTTSREQAFDELKTLLSKVNANVTAAAVYGTLQDDNSDAHEAWETAFNQVFSDRGVRRAQVLLDQFETRLGYCGPSDDYRVRVLAYQMALTAAVRTVGRHFP
jgi:hypothetical protein